ncbi:MAG: efflux RND transporter periplasmic adaptor subunit [Planctomycetota bacterium]|nr:efflux RND transporter periplasmic adaptor subunit [Planctomycetota bacterium]
MRLPAALVVLCLVPAALYLQESGGAHAARNAPQERTSIPLPIEVVDGVILPFLTVELNVPTDGVLAEVAYERGQTVVAGALLARLDSSVERESAELARLRSEFQSAGRTAEVKLDAARVKLQKRQSLLADGIVTAEEVEESLAEVALAELELLASQEEAQLAQVEHQKAAAIVTRMELRSPIDGVILERSRSVGELVTRSEEAGVFTIAQLDPLLVEVHAPVAWLGRVSIGDSAIVEPVLSLADPAEQPTPLVAKVRVIDRVANSASETVKIQFELPNPGGALPGGLRCKLRMATENH